LAGAAGIGALRNSLLLGLGVALAGTALALVTAWTIEGSAGSWGRAIALLAWVPIVIPGVAAGVGYVLVFGMPPVMLATMPILIAIVACWELPVTSRVARDVLVRTDRSIEDAAVSLGADRATTLTRIVAPSLRPVAGWLFGYLFAAGVMAVGTVIAVTGPGRELGALTMLTLAAAGATGAACAVATALLALAGGAVLLGRAIAGRQRGPTLLA
jgi:ABC-type Fe3+ transport system permease subunit